MKRRNTSLEQTQRLDASRQLPLPLEAEQVALVATTRQLKIALDQVETLQKKVEAQAQMLSSIQTEVLLSRQTMEVLQHLTHRKYPPR